ncbi:MAG: NAD(P)-dependent oxidoreductase [Thermomicrobiales bacterium]
MMSDARQSTVMLVTAPHSKRYADPAGSPLEACGNLRRVDWLEDMDDELRRQRFDEALTGADAIVVSPWTMTMPPFTDKRWAKASRLKVVAGTFDNRFAPWIDIAEAQRRGVTVIDTSRSMTPTVAEFALAMTLNLLRDIPTAVQLVRQGGWKTEPWDQPGFIYGDLTGRRVGLAGFGSINRRYAELISPFRCAVMTYDPFVADADLAQAGIRRVASLRDLAAESEIFVVGIPPTPSTQQIISREVIDALPRGASFILVTRMAVVDQDALWRRAEAGEIRAAIDVFAPEPPPADASFRTSPFVLPTPHIAGGAAYCHRRCFTTACADAIAVLSGRPPLYPATPHDDQLYRGTVEQTAG